MTTVEAIRSRALRALIPPPRLRLSEWIEGHIRLPEGVSAQPGPVRLWKFQREIADAIGDPFIERVTLVKPVRVGFTTLLTSAIAGYVANDPAPILALLPAEADCRDYVVSDVEPTFAASPAVADALAQDREEGERNTLLSRRFPGGSLKVVAARSPRNLRRHNVRVLFINCRGRRSCLPRWRGLRPPVPRPVRGLRGYMGTRLTGGALSKAGPPHWQARAGRPAAPILTRPRGGA